MKRRNQAKARRAAPSRPVSTTNPSECASGCAIVPVYASEPAALAASHRLLVDQVANLTVVAVQLWEQHNTLREQLGLARVPLPVAGSLACVGARRVVGP